MAKQNVSFAERHLEKIVVGVAGAILAAVVYMYIVQDPYAIDVNGQALGPSAFYKHLDEKVGEVVNRFKSPPPLSPPEFAPPPLAGKTVTNMPVVFVPPNPSVPKPEGGIELGGKLELVQVLPPGKPALTTGRGPGALAAPVVKLVGEKMPESSSQEKGEVVDRFWAAVFATVPRRAQQEEFIKAQYALDRQQLMVTKVEIQRERLLPNGEWQNQSESVMPYARLVLSCPNTVTLNVENGEPSIEPGDHQLIQNLMVEASQSQSLILRADFQSQLEHDFKTEWKAPAELPGGVKFDWLEDYKIVVDEGPVDSVAAGPAKATARVSASKMIDEINRLIAKAETAEQQRDLTAAKASYTEAEQKIDQLLGASATTPVPEKDKTRLTELQAGLKIRLQDLQVSESKQREMRAAAEKASLGPDMDVCWVTDTSVMPGETYRYRVRLLALNPHAGLLRRLKNAEDAAKVILVGQWSEWSDAVTVKPKEYLFFTGLDGATQNIKTELYQWSQGEFKVGRQSLSVGQPVSWTQSLQEYSYDGIIMSLDQSRTYEDRSLRRKTINYSEPRPTIAVTLVKSDGDVEEHLVAGDISRKRAMAEELMPKRPREAPGRAAGGQSGESHGRLAGG